MCFSMLDTAIAAGGIATRVRFGDVSTVAQVLRSAVPYGKAVLIAEEGQGFALAGKLRGMLGEFRPVCVVLGGEDKPEGLFSLADDVRAAVGIGERGALAARFFATLRGGYSCAVPLLPYAGGIFEPTAPARFGWGGYPLKAADFAVADGTLMLGGFAEGLARISLAAVCAEDLAVDAVFSGERKEFDLRTPARLALEAEFSAEGAKNLFCASALVQLALRGAPAFAAPEAAAALQRKMHRPLPDCMLVLADYYSRRYSALFGAGRARAFFVPDYVRRVERCAEWTGAPQKKLFKNVRVPTAEESFRRAEVMGECHKKLHTSAQILSSYSAKLRARYCAVGGVLPALPKAVLAAAYECSAELTPLLCPPVLEREFGLFPPEGKAIG